MNTDRREKNRAPRNRTLSLSADEIAFYRSRLAKIDAPVLQAEIENRTVNCDLFSVIDYLPRDFVDLLFIDPPYNLTKTFNGTTFRERTQDQYVNWLDLWFSKLIPLLRTTASVYICSDWYSSTAVQQVATRYLKVRNRITWEREKGRGASRNWKNCSEDIWFCTVSNEYVFDPDAVKLTRRVIAPYTDLSGKPKDWERKSDGDYRLTHASNVWTDLTVPFWSMPENTDHPTQKPEKLLAKIILASSAPDALVLDPFLGSGTCSVVAKKLGRRWVGIELDELYCCLAEKRLMLAEQDGSIQGFSDGVFWERNSRKDDKTSRTHTADKPALEFGCVGAPYA